MRGHDPIKGKLTVRFHVFLHVCKRTIINGQLHMGIRYDVPMPWIMFAAAAHSGLVKPFAKRFCQSDNGCWLTMEGAIADHS